MTHRRKAFCILASVILLIALPLTASGQGDPVRGHTLYTTTYKCTSCHSDPPSADPPVALLKFGVTVQGLLDAINLNPPMFIYDSTLANNPTDLADIAAYFASVFGPPPASTPDLNQHGLTGSWYEPATSGQGLEVEVYPNQSPGAGSAFVSWFTFDTVAGGADHQRWYTLYGPVTTGQPDSALTIYQNVDGNFNALPMTNATIVGTATLSFASCTSGQLTYSFSDGTGRVGTIPLTRLTQNVTCSTTTPYATNADFALSGNWYDPATSGQGFTVEINPTSSYLFAAWYTYEPNGATAGAAGQRWYTAGASFIAGSRSIPVQIYATTGGAFDTPMPAATSVVVGSGTLAFQSCTAATFSYTFTAGTSMGLSGTINLSRVGPVPPGCN